MSVIKPKLTFFQMKIEQISMDSTEFSQPGFSITPEAFNTVNMGLSSDKFILSMMHSKMFFVSQINQSNISAPAI